MIKRPGKPAAFVAFAVTILLSAFAANAADECEKPIAAYDQRIEAPFPPESFASLMDEVIENHSGNVTLTLVRHPRPSTQPADTRAAWVCMADGKPLWVIARALRALEGKSSGLTSRAIQRAREFVAEKEEMKRELRGKEKPRNWHPKKEALLSGYQSKEYGLQITEIRLIDQETESWEVTVTPLKESMGGEIWMRFRKGHAVSAESGR